MPGQVGVFQQTPCPGLRGKSSKARQGLGGRTPKHGVPATHPGGHAPIRAKRAFVRGMRRLHLLLFALLLSPGVALGQEAPQPAPPPPASEPAPPPPPAPPIPRAEPPPPEEQMPGMETLISGKSSQGGYGGPVLMYSRVMGKDALFFGGQG